MAFADQLDEQQLEAAFRAIFERDADDEQREHAANLRNDVFAFVFSR